MDARADAVGLEQLLQRFSASVWHANDIQVIDRSDIVELTWNANSATLDPVPVQTRIPPTLLGPLFEMPQLHTENRRLEAVQPAVDPFEIVVVLLRPAVVGKHSRRGSPLGVVGHQSARVTVCSEVLARIKAVAGDIREPRDGLPPVEGPVRLCGIAHHAKAMLLCQGTNWRHIGRLPIQMDRDDRFCSGSDLLFDALNVDAGHPNGF